MTRINDVKKVLRNTGVEMDGDDVVAELVKPPRLSGASEPNSGGAFAAGPV